MNSIPCIPENDNWLQKRIDRAHDRMIDASTRKWAYLWADIFLIYVRARNAKRTPAQIRELEKTRGIR